MKILFVFRCDFNTQPLGIMMLASVLKQAGHTCNFIDLRFDKYFLRKIINYKPDILAYSIVSFNWQYYVNINLKIKRRLNALSVFGGPHCSSYPDFINEEGIDIMCVGEGEHAFLELVNNLTINKDITNIKNLWVKKDGIIYKNELRPPFENLNALPFADQDIIRKYQF
ncbi:MAG: cobalamin B12-binding domain-containing protein, partial [Bacteroidales bacterium]